MRVVVVVVVLRLVKSEAVVLCVSRHETHESLPLLTRSHDVSSFYARRHLAFFVCHVHSRDVSLRAFEHVWVFERKKSRAGRPVAAFRQLHVRDARFDRVPDEGDLRGVGDDEGTARGAPTRRKTRDTTTLPR